MKRFFYFIVTALLVSINACADKKEVITFAQLPQPAQNVINQHFKASDIVLVLKEQDWKVEYEVRLADGSELDFFSDGELKKVDCQLNPVPEALLPQPVLTYVKATFPNAYVQEWGHDDRGFKAELNNGLELRFNKKYQFQNIDD
ncbi:MAG: PepSY-like domain-containing protein [Paludibacteraceae bacterium]|nr:PepSY-like domain-containing protein [Paludibacteraceae bacterium]